MFSNGGAESPPGSRPARAPSTNVQPDLMFRRPVSPGAGLAVIRGLSLRGLLGTPAAALPRKFQVVKGPPESRLRPETNPRYLSECLKRWLIIPMRFRVSHIPRFPKRRCASPEADIVGPNSTHRRHCRRVRESAPRGAAVSSARSIRPSRVEDASAGRPALPRPAIRARPERMRAIRY